MTRFERPVRSAELLDSPELRLRYPSAEESRPGSGTDEGVGDGFDLGSPRAYAERWFNTSDDSESIQAWFRQELTAIGWVLASDKPKFHLYKRDADETVGVATFGETFRIHFEVEGRWSDGSTDYRPS